MGHHVLKNMFVHSAMMFKDFQDTTQLENSLKLVEADVENGQIVSPLTAFVNDLMARKVDPGDLGSTGQEPTKQLG